MTTETELFVKKKWDAWIELPDTKLAHPTVSPDFDYDDMIDFGVYLIREREKL